ncbi:unnamed protein product [Echinostoma caproni]|uniref:Coiled-coil domain-containing protein 171 n=1 Tax=Echinostoma caproni TaxID=27848 RepID=A0A183ACV2_9TREM|nr:unnamed protein product [Echinostoma caproni]
MQLILICADIHYARVFALSHHSTAHWEINTILAERDELYEILRVNEEMDSARFANTQALIHFKQDSANEQQRLRQRIAALEEELEESMCRINQMNTEHSELKDRMLKLQGERENLEHQLESTRQKCDRELVAAKEEYAEREKQIIESERMTIGKLQSNCVEQAAKEVEMKREVEDLHRKLLSLQCDLEKLRTENTNLIFQQSEKERLWTDNHEAAIRQKILEKDAEIIQLNEKHMREIADLSERFARDGKESASEIRSCYMERVVELQKMLEHKECEFANALAEFRELNQKMDELLARTNLNEQEQQQHQQHHQQQQSIYQAVMNKLAELRPVTTHKCCCPPDETNESVEILGNMLRQELQQERERANSERSEAEKVRKNFEEYRTDCDRRFLTCTLEIERMKMSHEAELFKVHCKNDEKFARIVAQNATELAESKEKLLSQHTDELHRERLSNSEAFEKGLQCTSQILTELVKESSVLLENWSSRFNENGTSETTLGERFIVPEKEGIEHVLGGNELHSENPSFRAFVAQLLLISREKMRQLVCLIDHTLTEAKQHLEENRIQLEQKRVEAESTVRQLEHKAQLDLEKAEQRHIIEYQKKLQQINDKSGEAHLIAQLKRKDEELAELRAQLDTLESQTREKVKAEMRFEHEKELESKLLESAKSIQNHDCLSGSAATRVVIDLKNRVHRLREENLSLRRLLLRRLPQKGYTGVPILENYNSLLLHRLLNSEEKCPAVVNRDTCEMTSFEF